VNRDPLDGRVAAGQVSRADATPGPSNTAITARNRSSTTGNATNANPGHPRRLDNYRKPITAGVKHVLRLTVKHVPRHDTVSLSAPPEGTLANERGCPADDEPEWHSVLRRPTWVGDGFRSALAVGDRTNWHD
jgi:hypothetical protein